MNIRVIGEQYAWSFFYPEVEGEERVYAYNDMYVPVGMTDHARHRVQGRRALVVDPAARRQDGRGPGLHEQDLVPDPARRDARGRGPRRLRGPVRRAVRPQPRRHARPRDRPAVRRLAGVARRARREEIKTAEEDGGRRSARSASRRPRRRVASGRHPGAARRSSPTRSSGRGAAGSTWLTTTDHKKIGILYLGDGPRLLRDRRRRGAADADPARRAGQHVPDAGEVQRDLHPARDDDDLPGRRPGAGRASRTTSCR